MLLDFVNLTSLVILTSSDSRGSLLLPFVKVGLANTRVTLACLAGRFDLPPLKIKSFEFCALRTFADLAPKTNWIASPQFDLPEPLGPVIAVKPLSNGITASPLKDLKFSTSNDFRNILSPHNQGTESLTSNA